MTDPWAALGLDRGASPEDVKRAYRRLARENHPDQNPGDPAAAERFRRAAEAYRALTSAERRPEAQKQPDADVFGRVFGRRASRGRDLRYTLELDFVEAGLGGRRRIRLPDRMPCPPCGGTGAAPGSTPILCTRCKGTGELAKGVGFLQARGPCPECAGRGRLHTAACTNCGGLGAVASEREVEVAFSAGAESGTRLRYKGAGERGLGGADSGDLYVTLAVRPHRLLDRDGDDLRVDVPVPFALAVAGGSVRVPTLDGTATLAIPPGTPSGAVLRLEGRGIGGKGALLATVRIDVPNPLPEAARRALEAYAAAEKPHLSAVRAYEAALDPNEP